MKLVIKPIKIDSLQENGNYLNYRNQLVLNDNLDFMGNPDFIRDMIPDTFFPCTFLFTTFLICKSGGAVVRIDGRDFALRSNILLSIPPNCIVEGFEADDSFKSAFIAAAPNCFSNEGNEAGKQLVRERLREPAAIRLDEMRITAELSLLSYIRKIILNPTEVLKEEALYGALHLLNCIAVRALHESENEVSGRSRWGHHDLMFRFLTELNLRFKKERSVSYYANVLCLSPKHFAQVVYKKSGKYAKDWIKEYVIREAKTLLRTGNYTVQEVSDLLHFPNAAFFGKYFKKAVGCTPKTYRATSFL
jgi:AraC-like DNA-binding protein